jgi:hypothetical protein
MRTRRVVARKIFASFKDQLFLQMRVRGNAKAVVGSESFSAVERRPCVAEL